MAVVVQVKHRAVGGGGAGSPTGASLPGELAVNFDVTSGAPELWGSDGTAYKRLNPPATAPTVGTSSLPGGTAGAKAGIGAAWTAFTAKPSDPIVIATFAGTAYVKTGAGGADADWTALGSATTFASDPEVVAGAVTDKAVSPKGLKAAGLATPSATATADAGRLPALGTDGHINSGFLNTALTSTGAGSSGLIPLLNAAGKLDPSFLSINGLGYRGNVDVTAVYTAPTPAAVKGDFFTATKAGNLEASWAALFVTGQAPARVAVGDMLFYDGTNYHHIANSVDTSIYATIVDMNKRASKEAANTLTNAATFTWAAPITATTLLDGGAAAFSRIDNFTLDCGTF